MVIFFIVLKNIFRFAYFLSADFIHDAIDYADQVSL